MIAFSIKDGPAITAPTNAKLIVTKHGYVLALARFSRFPPGMAADITEVGPPGGKVFGGAAPRTQQLLGHRGRDILRTPSTDGRQGSTGAVQLKNRSVVSSKLYINARFRTRPISGVERYALSLIPRLSVENVEVVPQDSAASRLPAYGHFWEQIVLPRQLPADALLWSPCNFGPIRYANQLVTVHDVSPLDCPDFFSAAYRRVASLLLHRLAKSRVHISTVSEFSKSRLQELLGIADERIVVVPNGVDDKFFEPRAVVPGGPLSKFDIEPQRYFLTVGSLEPRKNMKTLLAAYQELSIKGRTARYSATPPSLSNRLSPTRSLKGC